MCPLAAAFSPVVPHDGYNQHCHDVTQPLKVQLIVIQLFKYRLHYHRHGQASKVVQDYIVEVTLSLKMKGA